MRFYNSVGPNPRVVTMFMTEKGIELPQVEIDLRGGEARDRHGASGGRPSAILRSADGFKSHCEIRSRMLIDMFL